MRERAEMEAVFKAAAEERVKVRGSMLSFARKTIAKEERKKRIKDVSQKTKSDLFARLKTRTRLFVSRSRNFITIRLFFPLCHGLYLLQQMLEQICLFAHKLHHEF